MAPTQRSIVNYLAQTIAFTEGSKAKLRKALEVPLPVGNKPAPEPSKSDKELMVWCQGIYMVAIYAAGGEFSFEESKTLELSFVGSSEIAPLLNRIFKNPKWFNYGNLPALRKLLKTWNLKGLKLEDFAVAYTGDDVFN